jgi:hypothetical protein
MDMAEAAQQRPNLDDVATFTVTGKAGDVIFKEGDTTVDMYIVLDGEVEITQAWAGDARKIATMGAGDFFGETSLLEELPREVTARALSDYRLLRIDHSTFDQIVRESPAIAVRMLHRLSQRLRERMNAEARAAEIAKAPLQKPSGIVPKPVISAVASAPAAAKPKGPPVLVHASGQEFPVGDGDSALIGRVDRATGKGPPIDLTSVDTDRMLSRKHACIVRKDGAYFLREEAGTRNGTFVNGAKLNPGEDKKLQDGDELQFASVAVQFRHR